MQSDAQHFRIHGKDTHRELTSKNSLCPGAIADARMPIMIILYGKPLFEMEALLEESVSPFSTRETRKGTTLHPQRGRRNMHTVRPVRPASTFAHAPFIPRSINISIRSRCYSRSRTSLYAICFPNMLIYRLREKGDQRRSRKPPAMDREPGPCPCSGRP